MLLDLSENGFYLIFEITENRQLLLRHLSRSPTGKRNKNDACCAAAEIHVTGENVGDAHFAKHTGSSGSSSLRFVSHTEVKHPDGSEHCFLLSDDRMEATLHYRLYSGIAALRSWCEIRNIADEPLGLEYVSSFSYYGLDDGTLPPEEQLYIHLPHNAWERELNWKRYTLSALGYERMSPYSGKRIAVSNTGTFSTKEFLPMAAVENRETGSTLLFQIEHNGSWHWEISDQAEMLYMKLSGPTEQENHWYRELARGERFESVPCTVAVGADLNSALAEMTRCRRRIAPKRGADASLPVIFNDYMNCLWADPTEEKMLPVIERAAEAGAEYYVMDAGWYADGSWWSTVGEWQPCAWRFPHGMKYVFEYVREKGMIPGIWLEIEVMGIHCPLAARFPDDCFFLRHGRRVIDRGRYLLDFRNPAVRAFASGVIDRLAADYGVGYFKLDYNVDGGIGTEWNADSFGDGLLEHNRAYLAWLRGVREKHPQIIFENCSSGGMRMDYAMLSVSDLQSVTDQSEARLNAPIAAACATGALPCQAAIWSYPKEDDSENTVVLNMVNALLTRIHLSGAITRLSPANFARVAEAIRVYKTIRAEIPESVPFYPFGIPQQGGGWLVAGYRYPNAVRFAVWRMDSAESRLTLPGVRKARILYPACSDNTFLEDDAEGAALTLRQRYSAVILEAAEYTLS
ncbi:MAG: alpha-galactosidase [Eubacteriales bacterium]